MIATEWPEGRDAIRMLYDQIRREQMQPRVVRRQRVWSADHGDAVDVDRLRAGQPFWESSHREAMHGSPVIRLVCQVAAAGFRDGASVFVRGACTAVLADILEDAGYRTEIDVVRHVTFDCETTRTYSVTVKRASEPLDLDRIIIGTSPWFYRTVMFQLQYVDKEMPSGRYAGSPATLMPARDEFVIQQVWNVEAATEFVEEVLRAISSR